MKLPTAKEGTTTFPVTTFAVVWIEIYPSKIFFQKRSVTTFAVVWIEIPNIDRAVMILDCHHLRGGVD